MHWACHYGYEPAVQYLLELEGFDVNLPSRSSQRLPQHYTVFSGDETLIKMFQSDGRFDIYQKNYRGMTYLDHIKQLHSLYMGELIKTLQYAMDLPL
jgi:Ankyrin repeats (many copies)